MCQHQTIYGRRCMDCLQRVDFHARGVAAGRQLIKNVAGRRFVAQAHVVDNMVRAAALDETYDHDEYYFLQGTGRR